MLKIRNNSIQSSKKTPYFVDKNEQFKVDSKSFKVTLFINNPSYQFDRFITRSEIFIIVNACNETMHNVLDICT